MSDLPSEVSDEGQQLGYDMEEGEFDMDEEAESEPEGGAGKRQKNE